MIFNLKKKEKFLMYNEVNLKKKQSILIIEEKKNIKKVDILVLYFIILFILFYLLYILVYKIEPGMFLIENNLDEIALKEIRDAEFEELKKTEEWAEYQEILKEDGFINTIESNNITWLDNNKYYIGCVIGLTVIVGVVVCYNNPEYIEIIKDFFFGGNNGGNDGGNSINIVKSDSIESGDLIESSSDAGELNKANAFDYLLSSDSYSDIYLTGNYLSYCNVIDLDDLEMLQQLGTDPVLFLKFEERLSSLAVVNNIDIELYSVKQYIHLIQMANSDINIYSTTTLVDYLNISDEMLSFILISSFNELLC